MNNLIEKLCVYCKKGNIEDFKEMLNLNNSLKKNLNEFLHIACEIGNLELVKYLVQIEPILIERVCEVIYSDYEKTSPMSMACKSGNLELVKYLLEQNIDINFGLNEDFICDRRGVPNRFFSYGNFSFACLSGNLDLIKYLIKLKPYVLDHLNLHNAFSMACKSGNIDVVKYLLKLSNVTKIKFGDDYYYFGGFYDYDYPWQRFFRCACLSGNLDLVKYLLELKPSIDIDEGFESACESDNLDLIKYLLKIKPTIDIKIKKISNYLIMHAKVVIWIWLSTYLKLNHQLILKKVLIKHVIAVIWIWLNICWI
jgi:ankyrin repeat protein